MMVADDQPEMIMLTAERLREVLHYDPATGHWRWLVTFNTVKVGDRAGWTDRGYIRIAVDGHSYRSARLAWLYMTGAWPPCQVDHENTVESDDRWDNLRVANESEQQANRKCFRNNVVGVKGVRRVRDTHRFAARIYSSGTSLHLGCFDTIEEAGAAYAAAAQKVHGEFARS